MKTPIQALIEDQGDSVFDRDYDGSKPYFRLTDKQLI